MNQPVHLHGLLTKCGESREECPELWAWLCFRGNSLAAIWGDMPVETPLGQASFIKTSKQCCLKWINKREPAYTSGQRQKIGVWRRSTDLPISLSNCWASDCSQSFAAWTGLSHACCQSHITNSVTQATHSELRKWLCCCARPTGILCSHLKKHCLGKAGWEWCSIHLKHSLNRSFDLYNMLKEYRKRGYVNVCLGYILSFTMGNPLQQ